MKKKILLMIGIALLIPSLCWSQGKVTRPKKTEPEKKETPKKTQTPKQTTPASSKRVEPVFIEELQLPTPVKPSNEETINGITVKWYGVDNEQKEVISNILKNMIYIKGNTNINSFWINKYEVSQSEWQSITKNNPSYFSGEDLPVENISFTECLNFIDLINKATGLKFRIPSLIEWEFAAEGGNDSNKFLFSGSNKAEDVAWFSKNSNERTHKLGTKKPNELGIYDMSGNVFEFTSDSIWELGRYMKIIKGGSWYSNSTNNLIIKNKNTIPSTYNNNFTGLRLAM